MDAVEVAIVGGGQAGLATSHELARLGVEHVVLERSRIGQAWRDRWDSFCLVTPNWSVQLPGGHYDGDDPDGYMPRDDIAIYLDGYAAGSDAPVKEGVDVLKIEQAEDEGFFLRTSDGDIRAGSVVLATGAYQKAHLPRGAGSLPADIAQLSVADFRNEGALAPGKVLIVGSGQSGCQIAEELHQAGRDVVIACGKAPWLPRRLGGRDIVAWVVDAGFFETPVDSLPVPDRRLFANILSTGHDGGHDLHLRTLQAMGVTLAGRFLGADGHRARFAPDLAESVSWGDARYRQFMDLVRKVVAERGLETPDITEPEPFNANAPETVDLSGFGAVIFAGGFRPDYSWLGWPSAFDDLGFPIHEEGASTVVKGLYFVGVHFLRKRKSSLLYGVGEDATIVAEAIAAP